MLGIIRLAMPRRKAPEDLTVEELRRLLIEKRRGARRERIEHFRRTGRVVAVAPDLSAEAVETEHRPGRGRVERGPARRSRARGALRIVSCWPWKCWPSSG